MEYQIAMLLKQHMCNYCRDVIGDHYKGAELTYLPYATLSEMEGMLEGIKLRFDAVITSGLVPHNLVISRTREDEITAGYFGFDIENTYRIILQQSMRRKNFSLSRIGVDFVSPEEDVAQVIDENRMPELVRQFEKWLCAIPIHQLDEQESGIARRYLERYKNGEIDFIVTYFYSTVLAMEREGIDCFYLYPNMGEIQHVFDSLTKSIRLRRAALPAVVRIDVRRGSEDAVAAELQMAALKKTVLEVLEGRWNDVMLRTDYRSMELYLDSHMLKRLTNGMTKCFLSGPLREKAGFAGTVGYGVSSDLYHARINAIDASDYASHFHGRHPDSYLIGADEKLVQLMPETPKSDVAVNEESAPAGMSPEWVRQKAQQVRLSPETLTRILEVTRTERTDRISSAELTGRLGVSLRTANRFLANLHRYGLAELCEYRHAAGKGRPIAVYRILLETAESGE